MRKFTVLPSTDFQATSDCFGREEFLLIAILIPLCLYRTRMAARKIILEGYQECLVCTKSVELNALILIYWKYVLWIALP